MAVAEEPAEPPSPKPTPWDMECMAWHEAGHAVVSMALPERGPIIRVSIEPGDTAFGFMQVTPRPDHNDTAVSLGSTLAVLLAGPLSERLFLGRATTGAAADLADARTLAHDMVLRFGMGPRLGLDCPVLPGAPASDRLLRAIEADIARLLKTARRQAERILRKRASAVKQMAEALLSRHTLAASDMAAFEQREGAAYPRCGPSGTL